MKLDTATKESRKVDKEREVHGNLTWPGPTRPAHFSQAVATSEDAQDLNTARHCKPNKHMKGTGLTWQGAPAHAFDLIWVAVGLPRLIVQATIVPARGAASKIFVSFRP